MVNPRVYFPGTAALVACGCFVFCCRSVAVPLAAVSGWIFCEIARSCRSLCYTRFILPVNIIDLHQRGCLWLARFSTLIPPGDAPCPRGGSGEWHRLTPMWLATLGDSAARSRLPAHGPWNVFPGSGLADLSSEVFISGGGWLEIARLSWDTWKIGWILASGGSSSMYAIEPMHYKIGNRPKKRGDSFSYKGHVRDVCL